MQVIEIKPDWLVEIAPHYYKLKDVEDGNSSFSILFNFFKPSSNDLWACFSLVQVKAIFCCIFSVLSGCTLSLGYGFCMVSVIISIDRTIGVSLASRHAIRVDFI
jgi:hypothetical protein